MKTIPFRKPFTNTPLVGSSAIILPPPHLEPQISHAVDPDSLQSQLQPYLTPAQSHPSHQPETQGFHLSRSGLPHGIQLTPSKHNRTPRRYDYRHQRSCLPRSRRVDYKLFWFINSKYLPVGLSNNSYFKTKLISSEQYHESTILIWCLQAGLRTVAYLIKCTKNLLRTRKRRICKFS